MGKKISLEHEGIVYTLEYTRKSIETMERRGFKITEIEDRPMNVLPEMFYGAFMAHHTGVKRRVVDDIFERMDNKRGLLEKLAEMYVEPLEKLFDGDAVTQEQKISWDADF